MNTRSRPSAIQYLKMFVEQIGQQKLEREQEPDMISGGLEQAEQYKSVMKTKLAISYAIAIETLHHCLSNKASKSAIDLACGPGVLTALMAKHLHFSSVEARDLSESMLQRASETSEEMGLSKKLKFKKCDIRNLIGESDQSFDVSTFCDAAHHMPTFEDVKKVLREMDRVTRKDGVVFLMDLVRLRTAELTEKYVDHLGIDYIDKGLPFFLEDFRHSMYAAWTVEELSRATPENSNRDWYQIVPRFLPVAQFVIGVPKGRKLFVEKSTNWTEQDSIVPSDAHLEWQMARLTLKAPHIHRLSPSSSN